MVSSEISISNISSQSNSASARGDALVAKADWALVVKICKIASGPFDRAAWKRLGDSYSTAQMIRQAQLFADMHDAAGGRQPNRMRRLRLAASECDWPWFCKLFAEIYDQAEQAGAKEILYEYDHEGTDLDSQFDLSDPDDISHMFACILDSYPGAKVTTSLGSIKTVRVECIEGENRIVLVIDNKAAGCPA